MRKKPLLLLGEGYFDFADCRRSVLLYKHGLDSDSMKQVQVKSMARRYLGRKVRLFIEVLK